MPPKRKNGDSEEQSGREKKKQKVAMARTISIQQSSGANASAGTSSVAVGEKLPTSIDVEKFAQARAFEINAMQQAMKSASAASTSRAWQLLPRHLRRRAASHDVRRVPLKLRDKARAEMGSVAKKVEGRVSKRGKGKQISRTESFLRRQHDKSWLETHLWHAKRMRMENMWGYRLAVEPTEKSFRPSHRASVYGSILHDASYYGFIELKGLKHILKSILERCCDPQSLCTNISRTCGSKVCETHIYAPNSYPFDLIAPVSVLWRPVVNCPIPEGNDTARSKSNKEKGKEKQTEQLLEERTLWIRCHPAPFDAVFSALQFTSILVLNEVAATISEEEIPTVEMADLRGQLNVFEMLGPMTSQVIRGALSPVKKDEEFGKFWNDLKDLGCAGQVPRGMVIGCTVEDPRLKFPPKNVKSASGEVLSSTPSFPSTTLARSDIWDEAQRLALQKPRYKKKDLDERRSKHLVPGTPLQALRKDDRIPILLIQRSLESSDNSQGLHGWTLIIPSGWAMPFFSSLTYTGTRTGGQKQCRTQAFEAGCSFFPREYPLTKLYDAEVEKREREEKERWERKPPAKRSNYEKLGITNPWKPDWYRVLGLECPPTDNDAADLLPTQRDEAFMAVDAPDTTGKTLDQVCKPWLLRGPELSKIKPEICSTDSPATFLLDKINISRRKHRMAILDAAVNAEDLLKTCLVNVRLKLCARGKPGDMSIIYTLEDEEAKVWWESLGSHDVPNFNADPAEESTLEQRLSTTSTDEERLIGWVTAGNFCLSRGKGYALGAIPLARYLQLEAQCRRLFSKEGRATSYPLLVKVRDRDGHVHRLASLELLT